jgi:pSer/pThr/pTyr-binding forkhead associated (FHA) protein
MLAIVSFESTTLEPEPRSDELSIDRTLAWLVPLDGPDRTPIELRGGDELSIGRSRSSSIAIDDASVSRLHATIAWKGGDRVVITDHESRRGTEVDGQKLTAPREVGHGAVLRVGPRRFIVLLPNVAEARASTPRASAMERVRELVRRAAKSELPVLLVGKTGVGKELLARAIHEGGSRSAGPFVAQNCGAITETLAESILFGHEKGAFTGAHTRATGVFEAASGGTLFLDEVGELPPAMQTRLLRVIEQREVTRVGATRPTPTRASSSPHIATSTRCSRRARSARTCSTGSTSSASACRPCASASTSCPSSSISSSPSSIRVARSASTPPQSVRSPSTTGPATCASCATSSGARSRCAPETCFVWRISACPRPIREARARCAAP